MAEADTKISALTAITSADGADELLIIDKSDTTDGLGGTGKKITASNFKADLVAKVSTTVADNIPTFSNTTGSLKDSGKKLADYSLTTHNHSGVYEPADPAIQSHISSTSNPHSVTAEQVGAVATTGGTMTGALEAADHGAAATDQVVNVCYGTGEPPPASTTTEGTLFIKYTN